MIILDTNVVSELMRAMPDPTVVSWMGGQISDDLHISSITVAETLFGIQLLLPGKRQQGLQEGADRLFKVVFANKIVPFDGRAAWEFSLIASSRRKIGRPISDFDAQIAAIATAHNALLATRDITDFEGCGLRLLNPWQA